MKFRVDKEHGDVAYLHIEGQISQRSLSPVADPIKDLLGVEAYKKKVLLDLSGTSMVDSSGIGWMIMVNKRFKEHGGQMVLHSYTPLVANTFKLMRIDQVLHLCHSLQDADSLVTGGSK
ncbi:anti-sigma-factor antagonist [Pirellula staleyi DSM 6068]|uniref:Anti-sigma-factor antagonist n=1 Tax=Pirellula staleyi (strain ATCC 27377 / DSM 6068 / ICPB 4128) TaxID=530564 RepID=D2QYH1_PIRSD|nr:STAS domain-containing protein [Pirellula staleyi]ADB18130.1 anti-sigma-factor antagonist [Pirellula staleyi DSM 6068]